MTTVQQVVREEAAKFGFNAVTDDEIETVVWNYTGYPCFWSDASISPEENFRKQLGEFFGRQKASELVFPDPFEGLDMEAARIVED